MLPHMGVLVHTGGIKLIDQAWYDREGVRFGVKISQRADAKLLDETLEFMQHVMTGTSRLIDPP